MRLQEYQPIRRTNTGDKAMDNEETFGSRKSAARIDQGQGRSQGRKEALATTKKIGRADVTKGNGG